MNKHSKIGHNSGDAELTELHKLQLKTDEFIQGVDRFSEQVKDGIQDDETANKAGNFRKQIKALIKTCDDQRKIDKKPHFEAGKQVDDDYRLVTEILQSGISKIDKPLLAYSQKQEAERQAQLKAEREAQAKADAMAEAAMEKATETQTLADKQAALDKIDQATKASETAEKTAATKTTFGHGNVNGRATSVKMVTKVSAKIADTEKAAMLFHSHPDVIATIEKLATNLLKQDESLKLDGIERVETQSLR